MFISLGDSGSRGSHLLKKPGRGLPDSGMQIGEWQRSLLRRSPLWHFQWMAFCRTTAVGGFLGVSIGVAAAGTAGGLGVAGATWVQWLGLLSLVPLGTTQVIGLWCSWGYISQHLWCHGRSGAGVGWSGCLGSCGRWR